MPSKTVTVAVSTELADAFERYAHLLAPATVVGKAPGTDPVWCTYLLHHPDAPPGAATASPIWQRGSGGSVSLFCLEWYDQAGRPVPAAPGAVHGPVQ